MEAKKPKQQQKSKSKTSRNKNLEFSVITYIFLLLFICLMGYFVYFQVVKSEKFINSPYNSLQDLFSKNVVRGEIRNKELSVFQRVCTCCRLFGKRKSRIGESDELQSASIT